MQAQLTIPTGRLMLFLRRATRDLLPLAHADVRPLGDRHKLRPDRDLRVFAVLLGAILPLWAIGFKATRMRRRMEQQFPVALDVFVRGLRADILSLRRWSS